MTVTVEQLVNREVHYCVSYLVSSLASGFGMLTQGELSELTEQACELAGPIEDWEGAAEEAGWSWDENGGRFLNLDTGGAYITQNDTADWQELCEYEYIEPHYCEVFEHWLVSGWLADQLFKHGEKVDKDFAGMIVWARTTTGQGIAQDHVIQTIHAELIK